MGGICRILNDSFVALRAGTNHPWGVVVLAGTGSVVAGRNPAGETFRTLGLGPMFGDDSSASEISEAAVGAVAAQELGRGPHTELSTRMCELTETATPMALLEAVARGSVDQRRFAPTVIEVAERGDLVARRLLEHAGSTLGDLAGHVARRLQMDDSEFELVLAGNMFRTDSRIMRAALEATVKRSARFAYPVTLEAPPVVGAVLLALEFAGRAGGSRSPRPPRRRCDRGDEPQGCGLSRRTGSVNGVRGGHGLSELHPREQAAVDRPEVVVREP